jgi:hypothetical protein
MGRVRALKMAAGGVERLMHGHSHSHSHGHGHSHSHSHGHGHSHSHGHGHGHSHSHGHGRMAGPGMAGRAGLGGRGWEGGAGRAGLVGGQSYCLGSGWLTAGMARAGLSFTSCCGASRLASAAPRCSLVLP